MYLKCVVFLRLAERVLSEACGAHREQKGAHRLTNEDGIQRKSWKLTKIFLQTAHSQSSGSNQVRCWKYLCRDLRQWVVHKQTNERRSSQRVTEVLNKYVEAALVLYALSHWQRPVHYLMESRLNLYEWTEGVNTNSMCERSSFSLPCRHSRPVIVGPIFVKCYFSRAYIDLTNLFLFDCATRMKNEGEATENIYPINMCRLHRAKPFAVYCPSQAHRHATSTNKRKKKTISLYTFCVYHFLSLWE